MRRWLEMPHIREWWGEPETELGYIRDMIEGRDTTRPFIFSVDGEPVGYIQYWFIGDHQNATWIADHPWLAELPSDAVGVDLSIGDPDKLSQGIGSAALRAVCASAWSAKDTARSSSIPIRTTSAPCGPMKKPGSAPFRGFWAGPATRSSCSMN